MLNLYDILKKILNESVSSDNVNDAINNKYQVLITYSDEKNSAPKERIIEPYAYGMSKAGNEVLRAFQYNGDTLRGIPKWKLFRLDRITSWKPTERHFNISPDRNGWTNIKYNNIGDNTMSVVLNQVNFGNNDDLFSPNDRLNQLRKKTQNIKNSKPINIYKSDNNSQNNKGPIINNTISSISTDNNDNKYNNSEFRKMLDRNLEITKQEKAKRGFSLSNDENTDDNKGPIINNTIDNTINNNNSNVDSEFRKMLDRNLEITKQEKAKRGFDINKIKN